MPNFIFLPLQVRGSGTVKKTGDCVVRRTGNRDGKSLGCSLVSLVVNEVLLLLVSTASLKVGPGVVYNV